MKHRLLLLNNVGGREVSEQMDNTWLVHKCMILFRLCCFLSAVAECTLPEDYVEHLFVSLVLPHPQGCRDLECRTKDENLEIGVIIPHPNDHQWLSNCLAWCPCTQTQHGGGSCCCSPSFDWIKHRHTAAPWVDEGNPSCCSLLHVSCLVRDDFTNFFHLIHKELLT